MTEIDLRIKRLDRRVEAPRYFHKGDAGLDLRSAEFITIDPGQRVMVPTGIAVAIPEGYAGFVQPRSGLAKQQGVTVLNTPGLIDSGYRGEIKVILINTSKRRVKISENTRIAQLVILPVPAVNIIETDTLDETERGTGGFGSTGIN